MSPTSLQRVSTSVDRFRNRSRSSSFSRNTTKNLIIVLVNSEDTGGESSRWRESIMEIAIGIIFHNLWAFLESESICLANPDCSVLWELRLYVGVHLGWIVG